MRTATIILSAAGLAVAATNYTIDTSSISLTTKASWCEGQENSCTTLCDGNAATDTCDPTTLSYSCTCQNGSAPGLEYYTQTMPTYICNEAYAECIDEYANNATGQNLCTTEIKDNCGTLDPANYTAAAATTSSSSTSASATATAAATTSATASGSSAASAAVTTTSSTAGAMATKMAHYGNGVAAVAVGVFAYLL